jgi:nonribosomal peptide synthetase DhbF
MLRILSQNAATHPEELPTEDQQWPATAAQKEMWLLEEILGSRGTNEVVRLITLHGNIDIEAFRASVEKTASEVDCLRARFERRGDDLFLRLDSRLLVNYTDCDLRDEVDPEAAMRSIIQGRVPRKRFFERDTLHAFILFQLEAEKFVWCIHAHHLILDGYTAMLLTRRTAEIYTANINDKVPPPRSFGALRSLIEDEQAYLNSKHFLTDQAFWLEEISYPPNPTTLSPREASYTSLMVRKTIPQPHELYDEMRHKAGELGFDVSDLLFATVAIYLARMNSSEEVIIGMAVTGRLGQLARSTPCSMAKVVPLRLHISADVTVLTLSQSIGRKSRQFYRHQRFRSEELHRIVGSSVADDLFRVTVNYAAFDYNIPFGKIIAEVESVSAVAVKDIGFEFFDDGGSKPLTVQVKFNADLYDAQEIDSHCERWSRLLRTVVSDPSQKIGEIDILSPEEREQVLYGWNDTAAEVPDQTLPELFQLQAAKTPEAVAAVYEDSSLTYDELNRQANRLAHLLQERGVGPEIIVGICIERGLEMVVGLLGILKAGGAYLPIDPAYPSDRIAFMIEDRST